MSWFETLTAHLSGYKEPCAPAAPLGSPEFISAFVEATGSVRCYLPYRGAVLHFLRWADRNGVAPETFGLDALERFRVHDCMAPATKTWPLRPIYIGRLARFVLYLQYQGRVPSHGWTENDPSLCAQFRDALIGEGLGADRANLLAIHALHFTVWARLSGVERARVDGIIIEAFAHHNCRCGVHARPGGPDNQMADRRRISVSRFVRFLEGRQLVLADGVVRKAHESSGVRALDSAVRYEAWLRDDRGLARTTINSYMNDLAIWLPWLGEDASFYTAVRIREAAAVGSEKRSPFMQGRVVRSMRSYIGFRALEGHCSPALVHSLVSRPVYRLGSVPRHIDPAAVEGAIGSCDRDSAMGLRDRAILLLLAELGLRAIEVWRLHLDDLDWEKAEIRIREKGGRGAVMPLPQRAGDALLEYLNRARPRSNQAAVFLRFRRPQVAFANAGEITLIACKALARCGITGVGGAHVFRHTLATRLLRAGRNLQEVATVLGHRSLDSTTIYAKVDETTLKGIADPWMGGGDD